jgi:hypothetical protein
MGRNSELFLACSPLLARGLHGPARHDAYPEEHVMEELQKTQEYPKEREEERRRAQQPYEGDERRRQAPGVQDPMPEPEKPSVSGQDGTGSR